MDFLTESVYIAISLFIISILYSSVGHGGASGYLAVLSFFSFSHNEMATTALILNILVSGVAFYFYTKAGFFSFKLTLPFVLVSTPAAFIGGLVHVSYGIYYVLLAIALVFAAGRMLMVSSIKEEESNIKLPKYPVALASGTGIGFLSGIVGVGGGIFLSPIMILMKWAGVKETSATVAFFILVNSIAGIAGRCFRGGVEVGDLLPFTVAALIGGSIGSYMGAHKLSSVLLRRILSIVLIIAAIKSVIRCF